MLDRAAACTRSSATTASPATWSTRERRRASRSSASPGARTARRCIATASGRRVERRSTPSRPTRPSRPCESAGRAPGSSPRFRGRPRGGPGLQPATGRGRTQDGRGRAARHLVRGDDPNADAAERSAGRAVRRTALGPRARSGCRRPSARKRAAATRGPQSRCDGADGRAGTAQEEDRRSRFPRRSSSGRRPQGHAARRLQGCRTVFVRGNHKRLGKTVPRGFPQVLTGDARDADHRGQRPAATGRLARHGPTIR